MLSKNSYLIPVWVLILAIIASIFHLLGMKPFGISSNSNGSLTGMAVVSGTAIPTASSPNLTFVFPYVPGPDSPNEVQEVTEKLKQTAAVESIDITYTTSLDRPGKGFGPNADLLKTLVGSRVPKVTIQLSQNAMVLTEAGLPEFARLVDRKQLDPEKLWVNFSVKTPTACETAVRATPPSFQKWLENSGKSTISKICQRANIGWVVLHEPTTH